MDENFLQDANLNIIRYANCWEDADVLLLALAPEPGKKILSIASAGDNAFALLSTAPEKVLAVDLSQEQLFLTELKQMGIKHLEYNKFLEFIGILPSSERIKIYESFAIDLSVPALFYWNANLKAIEEGIIYNGKFEKYFHFFRKKIMPLIHSKSATAKLLETKSEVEQAAFYKSKWNTLRWRLLFRIFFSKYVMGRFGRDPEFLKQVDIHVGNFIFKRAEEELSSAQCQHNYLLQMIFTGKFGASLPFYLREENYYTIQKHIDKLQLKQGYIQDACTEGEKFDYMNLSNIFEYMPLSVFAETVSQLQKGMHNQTKIAYWNLMVTRKISDALPEDFTRIHNNTRINDCGFFYRDFICEQHL